MDMTMALKRHKQVGECAGGGQRAGSYKREEARLWISETRGGREVSLPEEKRGEDRSSDARPHL